MAARRGMVLAVVGASGAGKDSLMSYARARLAGDPQVLFVRRVVTREALAESEDHDTLDAAAFHAAADAGRFAVTWQAHGLHYAVPADIRQHLAGGGVAVVNGSRAALPAMRAAFAGLVPVHVTCRPDVLAARLAARGREDAAGQRQRLVRAQTIADTWPDAVEIDNSDDLAAAGARLIAVIRAALPDAAG